MAATLSLEYAAIVFINDYKYRLNDEPILIN